MKKTKLKRHIAYYLVVVMLITMYPINSAIGVTSDLWIDHIGGVPIFNGSGTEAAPYQIDSAEKLAYFAQEVNAGNTDYKSAYYELTADIDLSAHQWTPIGTSSKSFSGHFDGKGYEISHVTIGTIAQPDSTNSLVGLFGASYGVIENVNVNVNIVSSNSGDLYMGGLVGLNFGSINDSSATGSVTGANNTLIESLVYIGGLAGYNAGTVSNSSAAGDVIGGLGASVGGIVGLNESGVINNSYATGNITAGDDSRVGGFVGANYGGTINNSYATGNITGGLSAYIGGLVGESDSFNINNCYYNTDAAQSINESEQNPKKGTGNGSGVITTMTTSEMQSQAFVETLNTNIGANEEWHVWQAVAGDYPTCLEAPAKTYTVTFNVLGGSEVSAITNVNQSAVITEPAAPTKEYFTFSGWYKESNYTNQWNFNKDIVTANVTLYAKWSETPPPPKTYTVTFNVLGGSEVSAITNVNQSAVITEPAAPTKEYFTFSGWYKESNYTNQWNFNKDIVTANVTLYAKWSETPPPLTTTYTVTYDGNGATGGTEPIDTVKYTTGASVTVLANTSDLVRTGYTFAGWNTQADGNGTARAVSSTFNMGESNVTLYAKWSETPPPLTTTYTVTYDGNGATGGTEPIDTVKYTTGASVTVLANTSDLVRTGYTFAGWNTQADGNGTARAVSSTFNMGESNITLYAKWSETPPPLTTTYTVTYDGNGATGGTEPIDTVKYTTGASVTVLANTSDLVRTGYIFAGWNTQADGNGTARAVSSTFNMGESNITLYAKWSAVPKEDKKDSGTSNTNITGPTQETVIVIVNGQEQNAGTETKTTENGKSTVTVEVKKEVIESKIDEAIQNNTTQQGNVIQIPVMDTVSEVASVELTGDIVKKLEVNNFNVSVKRDNVEYIIPAEEITISKVAENLGITETDLVDIKVAVKITKLDQSMIEKYTQVAKTNGAELIFSPVSFELVAKTTKSDGTTKEVGISKFTNYVERIMEIPAGVDPSKITTGVVFNPDGTYSHIPTSVFQKDGKWYASLNSLTNSNYSVIWNSITVKSVENHWSKEAVNDLASRLVIIDPEHFDPDKAITRADFATYIVRALGLYRADTILENHFNDINNTDDRTLAILIANEYGIVSGYTDGTFKPDALITREEAMTMYEKAMKVTRITGIDSNQYQHYKDFEAVSPWAETAVKEVLSAHVFNGTSATTISPKSNLTYAEAAQAIKNLLVESKLINK